MIRQMKIMEEELNYAVVTFNSNGVCTYEKPSNLEIIYEELKTDGGINPVIPAPLYSLPHLVAAGLGVVCVILVSAIIALGVSLNVVMSEQKREKISFDRQKEKLMSDREKLNWTMEVILEYKNFPVEILCPQKVCKPCQDDWVLFQSNCYLFTESMYTSQWRTWRDSLDECRKTQADLVTIESPEEQEFISNHTKYYNDEVHGYWIGLKTTSPKGPWMWADESNATVTYWNPEQASSAGFCALSVPRGNPLANWHKTSCTMKNRWICEKRALIKSY